MSTHLMYVDNFIFSDKTVVYTRDHDKIEKNLQNFPDFHKKMQFAKATKKPRLSLIFDCSKYIVCLNMDLSVRKKSLMYFFDLNINLKSILTESPIKQIFSNQEINKILEYQKQLLQNIHITQREGVFFTLADHFELPSNSTNIFTCFDDNIVIEKAKQLGAYYAIQRTDLPQQIALLHEIKIDKLNNEILDLYCFVHFEEKVNPSDNGFLYIRFHDAVTNPDKIEDFLKIIIQTVGDIERAFLINTIKGFMMN